jgi:hypothetical protein
METSSNPPGETNSRDSAWAHPIDKLIVTSVPDGAINANVNGRHVMGALQGFGQLWQKTYKVRLSGVTVTPSEVMQAWRENFTSFWPPGNRFYPSLTGVAPGEVAVLNLQMPGRVPLSTGMLVIYVDDESFTLMTPEGHMEAGWITFSAFEEDGSTVAQVQSMVRAGDPFYEIGHVLFGHRMQEQFWHHTLIALATHFGVTGQVWMHKTCLDNKWQWRYARNVTRNAAIGTGLHILSTPLRLLARSFRRRAANRKADA